MYSGVELRHLRCAIAVADELHFTRAAQKLHITQSALTRQIRQLELQLGVALFIRDTRKVELTDAGRVLAEDGRKALEILDHGIIRAVGAGRGEIEVLRIAHSPFVDIHFFSQLRDFLVQSRLELKIEYVSETVADQIQGLLEGRFQAGIGPLPVNDDALSAVCLFREPMFVAVGRSHRLARKRRVRLSELGDEPVIWLPPKVQASFYADFLTWCRKQGYVPNIVQHVTSVSEVLDFVSEGAGVGFVKASASRHHSDALAFCMIGNPPYLVETGIIYRIDNRSKIIRDLVMALAGRFPCTPIESSARVGSVSVVQRPGSE